MCFKRNDYFYKKIIRAFLLTRDKKMMKGYISKIGFSMTLLIR